MDMMSMTSGRHEGSPHRLVQAGPSKMLVRQSIRAVRTAARTSSSRPLIELSPRICKRSLASTTASDGSGTTMPPDRQDTSENRRSFTTSKSWCYRLGPGNFQRILLDTPGLPVIRSTSMKAKRASSGLVDVSIGPPYPYNPETYSH